MMIQIPYFSENDNETQVRESFVAPLIRALGYDESEIRPEVPLVYKVQEPPLWIRADYVISTKHIFDLPENKIIIEVKRPSVPLLDENVLEQARLYSSHKDIKATFIILVNGINLLVYLAANLNLLKNYKVTELENSWKDLYDIISAETLRRYFADVKILEEIGVGGYGRVFKVFNLSLKRVEALKILHQGGENADTVLKRFNSGAVAQANLKHQYICEIYDLNIFHGRAYIRMEFIPGINTVQYVEEKKLSLNEKLELFRKICDAISFAHQKYIYHCDLKPANILVTNEGIPKIIDFDFCHLGKDASTILSQIVATIAYMDPTIWRDSKNRDAQADIYSIGLLFWSILTGKELVPGWTAHGLVCELNNDKALELYQSLILTCILEDRTERPKDVEEIVRLLDTKYQQKNIQNLIDGSITNFTSNSPAIEFEFRFRLWQQTSSLPGNVDFDRITKGIPIRVLTNKEKEFIFRSACIHWSRKYREIFKNWSVDDLTENSKIILLDRSLNEAHRGKPGESHPAKHAIDILSATDEYNEKSDSEKIAIFLLEWLEQEKRDSIFGTTLGILSGLKCFKYARLEIKNKASKTIIALIRERLSKNDSQIGRLVEILAKCGEDNIEVAQFAKELFEYPLYKNKAIDLLRNLEHSEATDVLISLLEKTRGTDDFEKIALIAVGLEGRCKRPNVALYLIELPDYPSCLKSEKLKSCIKNILNQ